MIKEIWKNNNFTKIDDEKSPRTFKELLGFLSCNGGKDCFGKFQGNVWKINRNGCWEKVCRNIGDLSYAQYLKLAK